MFKYLAATAALIFTVNLANAQESYNIRSACINSEGVILSMIETGFWQDEQFYELEFHRVLVPGSDWSVARELKIVGGEVGVLHGAMVRFNPELIRPSELDPNNQFAMSEIRDDVLAKFGYSPYGDVTDICASF